MADTKLSELDAQTGDNLASSDLIYVVDVGATPASRKVTIANFIACIPVTITAEMTGSGAAATDEYLFFDGGVPKTITVPESVAAQFAGVTAELLGSAAATTDELMISDGGVPKTISLEELFSALAILGFPLADIPEFADQSAAQAGLTGTGKLFRFATTGALGVTIA